MATRSSVNIELEGWDGFGVFVLGHIYWMAFNKALVSWETGAAVSCRGAQWGDFPHNPVFIASSRT